MVTSSRATARYTTPLLPLRASRNWGVGDTRVDPRDALRKLTSIAFSVYSAQTCRPANGMVIADNVVFEK